MHKSIKLVEIRALEKVRSNFEPYRGTSYSCKLTFKITFKLRHVHRVSPASGAARVRPHRLPDHGQCMERNGRAK